MGRALNSTDEMMPAIFASHDIMGVIDSLSTEEAVDYIGAMLFALQGIAAAKQLTPLSRLLAYAHSETRHCETGQS